VIQVIKYFRKKGFFYPAHVIANYYGDKQDKARCAKEMILFYINSNLSLTTEDIDYFQKLVKRYKLEIVEGEGMLVVK